MLLWGNPYFATDNSIMIKSVLMYSQIFFSFLTLFGLYLAYKIVMIRGKEGIGLGDGDNTQMTRAIRVQANFLENLLPFAMLFVIYELAGGNHYVLLISGLVFCIARVLHAEGLAKKSGRSFGRYWGTLLSWLVLLVLAVANLWQVAMRMWFS